MKKHLKCLKYLIDMHFFFVKESSSYMMGSKTLTGYYLYYPIAYYKFMRDSIIYLKYINHLHTTKNKI